MMGRSLVVEHSGPAGADDWRPRHPRPSIRGDVDGPERTICSGFGTAQ
jgi:hypothetical protein